MKSQLERLAEAVGYPARVPDDAVSFTFQVDDDPVRARLSDGRLLLVWDFPAEAPVEKLSVFAAGRMLREEATLAWDPARERAILWQGAAKGADDSGLVKTFRDFLNSRDWWKARMGELTAPKARLADLIINP